MAAKGESKGRGLMRQGQQNRRNRGRGRSNRSSNPLSRNYESNGPEVKIKGSAAHIAEKYMTLARDALSSGNTVTAENYFQHAEHYNRIIQAAQAKQEEHAASHSSNAGSGKAGSRNNNERRPRKPVDNSEELVKPTENSEPLFGTGKQPKINGNSVVSETSEDKPKRKPRVRRPKAAKTENAEDGKVKTKTKDEENNIVV